MYCSRSCIVPPMYCYPLCSKELLRVGLGFHCADKVDVVLGILKEEVRLWRRTRFQCLLASWANLFDLHQVGPPDGF